VVVGCKFKKTVTREHVIISTKMRILFGIMRTLYFLLYIAHIRKTMTQNLSRKTISHDV
jgi:hypothetical protein